MAEPAPAQIQIGERPVYGDVGFRKVLIISVVCHVLLLVVLPFVSTLFVKPKKVERPNTFQLVTAAPPVPPAPQRKVPNDPAPTPPDPTPPPPPPPEPPKPTPVPTPTPKPPEPKPEPKPAPPDPKPTPPQPRPDPKPERVSKPVEESTDDLASLLEGLPQPRAQISAVGVPQDAYLTAVVGKIERNFKTSVENSKISVIVSFSIDREGGAHDVRVTTSSGDGQVDREGLAAVIRSGVGTPGMPERFGKLPPHYSDRVEINITLRPTRRR